MNKVILSFLYLFFFNSLQAQVEYYDSEALVEDALKYIQEEKYTEARAVMAKVHPSDVDHYYSCQIEMASTYTAEEKSDEAIAIYKKLYDDNHFEIHPYLYVNYGSVLRDVERYEEAEVIYKEAESKFPNYSHLLFNMAISYYRNGETQKSIDYTKRAIEVNPSHSRAHYFLGVIALENGQIAEGSLAILGFLANEPNDDFAMNAIRQLNVKMAQNYLEEKDFVFSESGDDFSNLTLILRNQLALNDKYKLECEIDEIYTRHVQAVAEYSKTHEVKDGFFEKHYISFIADIYKKGHIENFTYYTLSGLEAFQDQLKKKEKDVTGFYEDYFVNNFWYFFGIRKREHLGKETDVIVFCEDNEPTMISEYKEKVKHGWSTFVDEYGRMTGKANLVDGLPEGIVTYYDREGRKNEELNFEKGEKNGSQTLYYETGEKYSEWSNVNGVAEGIYTTYYRDGSIYCQSSFKNGEYHDDSYCNYVSGGPKYKVNYDMGQLDGEKLNYYENGVLSNTEVYVGGKLNGRSEYFDVLGRKLSVIDYKDDEVTKNYSITDKEGNVTYDYTVDGNNSIRTDYINGKISQVTFSNDEEVTAVDYYIDGEKYISQEFDGEKLKKCIQYKRGDEKGKKLDLKNFKTYDLNGNLISHRKTKKGKLHGLNTLYYLNGAIRSELNYIDGKEDGNSKLYDKKGRLTNEYGIKEDVLHGLSKEYEGGKLTAINNYKEGKLNGPVMRYHANGSLRMMGFYKDDTPRGKFEYYNSKGDLINVDEFENAELIASDYMEKDGSVGSRIEYSQASGTATRKVSYSPVRYEMNLLNGELHGAYYGIDTSGDTLYVTNYINGERNGKTRYYSGCGKLYYEGDIVNGNQHGLSEYYDDLGVLRITSEFENDEENGIEKVYSYGGSVIKEYRNFADNIHGEYFISNTKGKVLMTLYYVNDIIVKYKSMMDKEWVELNDDKKSIIVNYDDGSLALDLTIEKGYLNGKFGLYDEGLIPILERNYVDGVSHGDTKYYYPNGKLYRSRRFENGDLHGDVVYYDEEGRIQLKYTNAMDQQDGPYEIYQDGKLKLTKIYEADELIEIK